MTIIKTDFEGLFVLVTDNFTDNRGSFQKLYNFDFFKENQLDIDFKEFYYSVSRKNVIRGMHFQLPPYDHSKLVYVSKGKIIDVVVDLRKHSKTYKRYFSFEMNNLDAKYLYIPKGFAHGFLSLENSSIVNYAQTSCYSKESDCGIAHDSFGYEWGAKNPIISTRDRSFEKLGTFKTPF